MSASRRSSTNLPNYYFKLNNKQKRNWRKNTRKMEKNERLKEKHPPFHASSNIDVIHIHYQSTISMIDELIKKAKETKRYVVDTESEKDKREEQGALIQIQFIHSTHHSTIILIETDYLPNPQSNLFTRIKELCAIIFSNSNKIISWGPIEREFKDFDHLDLIHLDLGKIANIDLQSRFSDEYNNPKTHPEMERRDEDDYDDNDEQMDDDYDDNDPVQVNSNYPISLQDAIATTFGKFIDKSLTVNHWQCGLDLNLDTWRNKLFSRREYNQQIEQQQREAMKQYAVNDCTSVAELFFHMYPLEANDYQIHETTTTTSRIFYINNNDELSDISEDELIEILKPKFNRKKAETPLTNDESAELTIGVTQQQMDEFNWSQKQIQQQVQEQTTTTTQLSKAERQKKKNMKLKWKQKHHPDFQNKITRPIYSKYDYRKIRAQLMDDDIHTSHQVTIDRNKQEVKIGFKTKEEREHATRIIRINYFSQQQFKKRWENKLMENNNNNNK